MMEHTALIRECLADMADLVDELRPKAAMSWDDYASDRDRRRIVERLLHLLAEASGDIARMYLLQASRDPGSSKAESLENLARQQVISYDMARALGEYVHARNVLAHTYRLTNDREVYDLLQKADELFTRFVAAVHRALPPTVPGDNP